jgi:hypothetical protein
MQWKERSKFHIAILYLTVHETNARAYDKIFSSCKQE